jgi:TolB-like protein/Tfp pilus assembly protein PilF
MTAGAVARPHSRTKALVRTLCLCACVAVPAVPAVAQCPDGTPPPCARPAARAAAAPAATSVAVLYFDNVSRDTSDAYIADGLTEELIARLGQIERLQVKSRTAVQRYRGRPIDDPTTLGRTLGVAHLVSGSIRRGGGRLRVTVELTRASTGVRVWGDTYERGSDDLMAVEADIAQAIAVGVGGRLAPTERRTLVARPTGNAEAYDHFLRGSYFIAQRAPAAARRALTEYETAVQLDPGFARAYGRIGLAYGLFYDWGWPYPGLDPDSLLERGSAAAATALRLDSLSADGWLATAGLRQFRFSTTFAGAASAYRRALALDPRSAEAWHFYGGLLSALGQDSAAAAAFRRALELEPERLITFENLGWLRYAQHRFAEAAQLVDSGLAVDPQAYFLYTDRAAIALNLGDTARARAAIAAAVRTRPPDYSMTTEPLVAAMEARGGDTASARARMERLVGQFADAEHPRLTEGYEAALGFALIGDGARAIALLERVSPRGLILWYYLRDPGFDRIRSDPRFQRLVAETQPPRAR